jgi:aryl-alcohol dehydrogenase
MRITAAVTRTARQPFSIEALELDEPRADEILVRIAAAGLSHTDLLARDQDLPVPLPVVLGREGAGTVERVGSAVQRFVPGDNVILTYTPGEQQPGDPYDDLLKLNLSGSRRDGSSPLHRNGERIASPFFGQSSFATHALVTERNTIKVEGGIPFPILAAFGGDVQIGAGTVINTLRPYPGSAIAIFGAGAVGLSAVMAARLTGCHPIIGVDIKASRLQLAERVGASYTIDPDGLEPVEAIRAISGGGAEFSVETTGLPQVTRQAVECLSQRGVSVLAGLAAIDAEAPLNLNQLRAGRTVRGSLFGDSVSGRFIPRLVEFYRQGRLPIDRIISEYRLDQINKAADDIMSGAAVKPVIMMP